MKCPTCGRKMKRRSIYESWGEPYLDSWLEWSVEWYCPWCEDDEFGQEEDSEDESEK